MDYNFKSQISNSLREVREVLLSKKKILSFL